MPWFVPGSGRYGERISVPGPLMTSGGSSGRRGREVPEAAAEQADRVFHQRDEDIATGDEPARVTQDDRYVGVQVERGPDHVGGEAPRSVEAVDGHDERRALPLEV